MFRSVAKQSIQQLTSIDLFEFSFWTRRLTQEKYPSPTTWEHATRGQQERAARSFLELAKRNVAVFPGPLVTCDDDEVKLQDAAEVAKRTLVLWAVELRAEGVPQEEAIEIVEELDLWPSASPQEIRFLKEAEPDPDECQRLIWRLESIWVLLWSLGYIEDLNWPSGICNVQTIVDILGEFESDPSFIANATLCAKPEILDAQDLIMRIHWAIRDAMLNKGGMISENLDWSEDYEMVSVTMSAAVGVVEQRHHALNWLVDFNHPENWDQVDTPT